MRPSLFVSVLCNNTALVALAFGIAACPAVLVAQSGAGSIQGTIQDSAGAIIPGVAVHVVKQDTGAAFDTKSNSAGFYSVPGLFTGNYTLDFKAPGMKEYQTSVALQDAQNAVINPQLTVGAVTERVTVTGDAVQLATYDSGTISTQLDAARIDQLPMNGRNLLTLAGSTVPGLEASGTRANGNMPEGLEYTQDGAPMTNRNFGGEGNSTQAQLPDPDSVQEVKIETTNSSAQFATPATSIITTKSGTNTLHGSIFETARNNAIGIAKARQNPANYAAPHLVRNEFGVNIGGPIRIPKLYNGTDKTFFFFAFERFSLAQSTNELVTVPTVAMRNGDFSGLVNSSGVLQVLYDPATSNPTTYQRTPFPAVNGVRNQIPAGRESPLAKAIYAATPLPTTADNPLVTTNYNASNLTYQTVPNITFRLDHVINQDNRVYLRFTDIVQFQEALRNYPNNSPATIAGGGLPADATGYQDIPITTISGALGYTHIFSPTLYAETIYSQQWMRQFVQGGGPINEDYEQILGLPNNFGQSGFPNIGANLIMPYGGSQFNYGMNQILSNIDENITKIAGKHQMAFGGRYRHERFGYLPDRSSDTLTFGAWASAEIDPTSGANYTALANTGYQDADLFLGAAATYSQAKNAPFQHYVEQEVDTYFQDNYHLNKDLTINAGLRWEIHPAPSTRDGTLGSFDLTNDALVLAQPTSFYVSKGFTTQAIVTNLQNLGAKIETPQQAGIPNSMFFNNNFCFSPRIGVAYTPFGSRFGTVLRGGYGRYIYPVPIRNSVKITSANVPFSASYSQSYIAANQSPDGLPNYLLRTPQSVIAGQNSTDVVNTSTVNAILPGVTISTLNPHYPPDYVTQFNATIEQPIKGAAVVRVTYLFDHGSNLDQNYEYNYHPSNYVYEVEHGVVPPTGTYASTALGPYDQTVYGSGNVLSERTGYSNDSALQLNFQRQFHKGYAYQIFYVYSRAFRVGGNTFRDSVLYPTADYLPGTLPSNLNPGTFAAPSRELNHYENYKVDTAIPEHHITFNGIADLPFGTGKRFLGNSNRFVNELIGGYQVAFVGNVLSQSFQPVATNWGPTSPLKVYGHSHPITDCRSGVCHKEYEWFNGYIAPGAINAAVNGVSGLPTNFTPYQTPINNTPGTANYGNNNVPVTLNNGSVVQVAYSPGPTANPFTRSVVLGPYNYDADISLYKVFPITERVNLRVNIDAFNALNIQGYVNPNLTDGTEVLTTSYWTPRQIQLTARLTF
jgi:hypothetical protein